VSEPESPLWSLIRQPHHKHQQPPQRPDRAEMIGDDFCYDPGVGVCGKAGQGMPVGVGLPSLKIRGLTVGGTSL
jgi:hypothetical protein